MKIAAVLLAVVTLLFSMSVVSASEHTVEPSSEVIIFQTVTENNSASDEYVLLYNQSEKNLDLTSWCLQYSSANDNVGFRVCVDAPFTVAAGTYVSFGTASFVESTNFVVDFVMTGGMSSTGGHIRLFDSEDTEVDRVGWGVAVNPEKEASVLAPPKHEKNQALSRNTEAVLLDTNDNFTDFSSKEIVYQCPVSGYIKMNEQYVDDTGMCIVRFCPNLDNSTIDAPDGYFKPEGKEICELLSVDLEHATLFITELFPNAPSTDAGNEFIEIYNPNDRAIDLAGYRLQVGPSYLKEYVFLDGTLEPSTYLMLSDTESGIVLPNTNGVQLRLVAPNGDVVDETTIYSNAKDTESWALVEDQWIYTNQVTPGKANKPYLVPSVNEVEGVTSVLAPCPVGKFRNPATNRCKNIETAVSQLVPCSADEFRNPETNRCNKASTTSSSLTPCKPGQVRNPETNRCRSTSASSSTLKPCDEDEERNPETNRCRKTSVLAVASDDLPTITDVSVENSPGSVNWLIIITAVLGTVGYILYEWRFEITRKLRLRKIGY